MLRKSTSYYWDFGSPSTVWTNFSTVHWGTYIQLTVGVYLVTLSSEWWNENRYFCHGTGYYRLWHLSGDANRDSEVNMEFIRHWNFFRWYRYKRIHYKFGFGLHQTCADWSSGNFMKCVATGWQRRMRIAMAMVALRCTIDAVNPELETTFLGIRTMIWWCLYR